MNSVISVANAAGRKYITPEDVSDALRIHDGDANTIRKDVLEVLGGQTGFGAEDSSLCAFIAWRGTP